MKLITWDTWMIFQSMVVRHNKFRSRKTCFMKWINHPQKKKTLSFPNIFYTWETNVKFTFANLLKFDQQKIRWERILFIQFITVTVILSYHHKVKKSFFSQIFCWLKNERQFNIWKPTMKSLNVKLTSNKRKKLLP